MDYKYLYQSTGRLNPGCSQRNKIIKSILLSRPALLFLSSFFFVCLKNVYLAEITSQSCVLDNKHMFNRKLLNSFTSRFFLWGRKFWVCFVLWTQSPIVWHVLLSPQSNLGGGGGVGTDKIQTPYSEVHLALSTCCLHLGCEQEPIPGLLAILWC